MDKDKYVIFKSDVESQLSIIEKIYKKIIERSRSNHEYSLEGMAYQLHNLYCAIEDVFKIVAAAFENNIEDAAKYHVELLKRMTQSIEGIRPNLVSENAYVLLDSLRSFRHFFRHAYTYELDERKIRIIEDDAMKVKNILFSDIHEFLKKIDQ